MQWEAFALDKTTNKEQNVHRTKTCLEGGVGTIGFFIKLQHADKQVSQRVIYVECSIGLCQFHAQKSQ